MLEINNFHVKFDSCEQETLSDISLKINRGEVLGLVGESGSGKTTLAMGILGLLSYKKCICSGRILFDDYEITNKKSDEIRRILGKKICAVFQQTFTAMDPLQRVGIQIGETLRVYTKFNKMKIKERVLETMAKVGLPPENYDKYPHELSGGMVQRAMIASAIVSEPEFLLLDEPTTALDIVTQEMIIGLLKKLNNEEGMSILLISHDLNIVRKVCTRIAVIHKGKLVEVADDIFFNSQHPYIKDLTNNFRINDLHSRKVK